MTIVLQAPGPNINFGVAPSGATYISDANGLVVVLGTGTVGVDDLLYLTEAGCVVLSPGGFGQNSLQTGTSYTVQLSDNAQEIICTSAGSFTLDLPNNMPVGFCVNATQGGAGTVTAAALTGASLVNPSGGSHATAAQYKQLKCLVVSNSGGANAVWDTLQVGS